MVHERKFDFDSGSVGAERCRSGTGKGNRACLSSVTVYIRLRRLP